MFKKAKPIWLQSQSEVMNMTAGFRCRFHAGPGRPILRITGSTLYRIRLNGNFAGHGPARCGHGYYRVDELVLPVTKGDNLLAIEVAGYNANSYAYLDQPSFIQAEVEVGGRVLAWTGSAMIQAFPLKERIQKVQRYSFQRTFTEAYTLTPHSADWYATLSFTGKPAPIEVMKTRRLIERGVPYPKWETRQPIAIVASGTVRPRKNPPLRKGRAWSGPRPEFKAFPADRQTLYPSHEIESLSSMIRSRTVRLYSPGDPLVLNANGFKILDLGTNLSGFIGLTVECREPVDLYLVFDELLTEKGDVSLLRYGCANVIKYSLKPGNYELESFEPYTLKYLKVLAMKGACRLSKLYLREYACPDAQRGTFAASDPHLSDLFEAARQTFRQNAVDIFMDCPGRERAGWLCDSFFTARAERALCGSNPIERNFLENYRLPEKFPHLPQGMLPACYPSDHNDGNFIPNWGMWFVIEVEEYLRRSGDREMVEGLKRRVYGLIDYFKPFLNSDGLLESLEKWIFVEWSEAAKFVRDVNYPTNMLYAGMLEAAGRLFGDEALIAQGREIKATIRRQSFDGEFFVDNAIRRDNGSLEVTRNRTETCQYYAFFFNVATPMSHKTLWRRLLTEFGPDRKPAISWPEIHPANAFIGFFLRLDILSRYGEKARVMDQLRKYYLPMAQRTGTLWEHRDTSASCNHGFASHVAHILYRDILGIQIDPRSRSVEFSIPNLPLKWCKARIPFGDEWIDAQWHKEGNRVFSQLSVPRGFKTKIVNEYRASRPSHRPTDSV